MYHMHLIGSKNCIQELDPIKCKIYTVQFLDAILGSNNWIVFISDLIGSKNRIVDARIALDARMHRVKANVFSCRICDKVLSPNADVFYW